jgi:hypothetical protein
MAATLTQKGLSVVPGDKAQSKFTLALDASYPNPAGYVFTPASFGLNKIRKIVNIEPGSLAAGATWAYWIVETLDADNNIASFALHLAVVATGVEVANAVNVSTASYSIVVEGN